MLTLQHGNEAVSPYRDSAQTLVGQMSDLTQIRVFSVDGHPLLHEGLATVLRNEPDMLLVGEASSGRQAIRKFRECKPEVTLTDLRLPDMSGIDLVSAIRSEFPEARLIILTTFYGDVEIRRALKSGARGYILKSMPPSEVVNAIRQVHAGKVRIPSEVAAHLAEHYSEEPLTVREVEILRHLPRGNRTRDIAEKLVIAEETVKSHIKHIMEKLGATDRTQAVAIALRRGIIQL
jgi:DNA-binding NarL/FixJ family response regulator